MSDRWWTANRYKTSNGYSLVSTSNCYGNCYAYATGRHYWINGDGWGILLQDDYTQVSSYPAKFYTLGNPGSHAVKIHSFYPSGYIHKTREKNQTSGVYEKTYEDGDLEVGDHSGTWFWWN